MHMYLVPAKGGNIIDDISKNFKMQGQEEIMLQGEQSVVWDLQPLSIALYSQ